ncbi:Zcchc6 [Symbiodinium pilosum]|uniref:Zcchc6 protein n=1 Tax=Symbiodinium pilosum TaxID=2952 RepID=A0A812WMX7_SYMPI|nr:Zcchc6 [Symbiodinium pilosum]
MWHLCCVTAEESGPQEAVVTAPATSEVIPVVSAAAENPLLSQLEGNWNRAEDSKFMAAIFAHKISWAKRFKSPPVDVTILSSDKISVEVEGERLTAWFDGQAQLVWDDGDVWQKQRQTDVRQSIQRSLTKAPKAP